MQLGKYTKAPPDRKRYTIDYVDWLDVGELVSSAVYSIDPPTDTSPLVIDGTSINPAAQGVIFYASAGTDGTTYKVAVTMTTSNGQIREDTVLFVVRAP